MMGAFVAAIFDAVAIGISLSDLFSGVREARAELLASVISLIFALACVLVCAQSRAAEIEKKRTRPSR